MKKKNDYFILMLFILHMFVPTEYFFIIITVLTIHLIITRRSLIMPRYIYILLFLFIIQFIVTAFNIYETSLDWITRDIFYYLSPILYIVFGYVYVNRNNNKFKLVLRSIYMYIFIVSIFYVFVNILNLLGIINEEISSVRIDIGFVGLITPVLFLGLLNQNIFNFLSFSKKFRVYCLIMLGFSIGVSFSRTNLLVFFISFFVFFVINTRITRKGLYRFTLILFFAIGIFAIIYIALKDDFVQFVEKLLLSVSEVSSFNDWTDINNIVNNWRGYERYMVILQLKDSGIGQIVVGSGFGSKIYIGNYAHLVTNNSGSYIPLVHNGYYTMLIKGGVVGVFIYIYFFIIILIGSYNAIRTGNDLSKILMSIIFSLIITTTFNVGIFGGTGMFESTFLIGSLIYISSLRMKTEVLMA